MHFLHVSKEQTLMSGLITLLAYIYHLISTPLFWIIILFSAIDVIIGTYAAVKNKELSLNKSLNGVINKLYIGILILISAMVDFSLSYFGIDTKGIFLNFMMGMILTHELESVIRNSNKAGFWVPSILIYAKERLNQFFNKK